MPSSIPLRFGLIAGVLAAVVAIFAWVGGFLTPARISGGGIANVMQAANGKVYPGFRRAHAKGLCVSGSFEANGAGTSVSRQGRSRTPSSASDGTRSTGVSLTSAGGVPPL